MDRTPHLLARTLPALAALAALAAPAAAGDLGWTHTKDTKAAKATMTWQLESKVNLTGGAQPLPLMAFKVEIGYDLERTVTKLEGTTATYSVKITAVRATTNMMQLGMPMPKGEFDSAKPEGAKPMIASFGKAVGETFTYVQDAQGKVSQVEGGDAITEKITAAMEEAAKKGPKGGGGMGMGKAGQAESLALLAFNNDSLKSALNMLLHVFSKEGGSKWKIKHELDTQAGSMHFAGAYRTRDAEGDKTPISFKNDGDVEMKKAEGGSAATDMLGDTKLEVTKSSLKGRAIAAPGKVTESKAKLKVAAQGDVPAKLAQQMQMMGGVPPGGKLALNYELSLTYSEK